MEKPVFYNEAIAQQGRVMDVLLNFMSVVDFLVPAKEVDLRQNYLDLCNGLMELAKDKWQING